MLQKKKSSHGTTFLRRKRVYKDGLMPQLTAVTGISWMSNHEGITAPSASWMKKANWRIRRLKHLFKREDAEDNKWQ